MRSSAAFNKVAPQFASTSEQVSVVSVLFPSTNKMNRDRSTLSPERRHLTKESIMRIQITLSSRKSSVVVFNTYARLVAVGNGQWNSIAVGAPCILLVKETSATDSRFQVRLAIVEVESGIAVWEEELDSSANYSELQPTFHTFTADDQSLALQFADAMEASSLIDCLKQYIAQKTTTDIVLEEKSKSKSRKSKKNDTKPKVSKLDISSPCEFRHLSGITAGHTNECQQELEGTIMRRQRSFSMSAISTKNVKQRGKIPKDMAGDSLYLKSNKENVKKRPPIETPIMQAQQLPSVHNRRGLFKSSSVRLTKRKPIIDQIKTSDDSSINSTLSHTTLNSAQDHSYWTIDDLQNSRTKSTGKSSNQQNEPTPITFKNSAPSQIQQAWRNSINTEDSSSKSSRSSTPHHGTATSPAQEHLLDRRQTWTDGLLPLNSSPAHIRLNTSPEHQLSQTTSSVSSPPHVVAAANAKKYIHVKPSFNTYDTLLPLESSKKLPPLAPISNNVRKENSLLKQLSAAKTITTKPPPLTIKENGVITPPTIDSPGDLDVLSAELSKVLKDFDSLITPSSPLESAFQYTPTFAKETMV